MRSVRFFLATIILLCATPATALPRVNVRVIYSSELPRSMVLEVFEGGAAIMRRQAGVRLRLLKATSVTVDPIQTFPLFRYANTMTKYVRRGAITLLYATGKNGLASTAYGQAVICGDRAVQNIVLEESAFPRDPLLVSKYVTAHELGHALGALHAPYGPHIMSPYTNGFYGHEEAGFTLENMQQMERCVGRRRYTGLRR